MRALGILNLPQQLSCNKGIFMHKVFNNNSPNYLAQLFISHASCSDSEDIGSVFVLLDRPGTCSCTAASQSDVITDSAGRDFILTYEDSLQN